MCRASSHSSGGRRCKGCSASARRAAYGSLAPEQRAAKNETRRAKVADLTDAQKAEANARRRAAYAARQAGDATTTSSAVTIETLYEQDDQLAAEINTESLRAHAADPNTFIEPTPEAAAEARAAHERIAALREQREALRAEIARLRKAAA